MNIEITKIKTYMREHKLGPTEMGKALTPTKPRQRINAVTDDDKDWYIAAVKNKLKLVRFQ